jgi:phospholipid transport system transporter-binding protein
MTTLTLPATLMQAQATASLAALRTEVQAGQGRDAVQVDASALGQFDSSALAVLLELRRDAHTQGRTFAVRGMPQRLTDLAALYGVGELLSAA